MVEQLPLRRSARLDPAPASVGAGRRLIRQALTEVGETAALDAAQLAVSELLTNAVLHAGTAIELTVEVTRERLIVYVRDGDARLPSQRHWGETATTGRGLALVASVSDDFGFTSLGPGGKTVWFQILRASTQAPEDGGGTWDVAALLSELDEATQTRTLLAGLPVRLWAAGQQHWEAVLRELYLQGQSADPAETIDLRLAGRGLSVLSSAVERTVVAAVQAGAALTGLPPGHPSPLPPAPASVDVSLSVSPLALEHFAALQDALDLGVRMGAARRLLLPPELPEIIALRDWACEQAVAQGNGIPPSSWAGADHPRFIDPATVRHTAPLPAWDASVVTASDRPAVAADDNNRIVAVSAAAAAMLGWAPDGLVGRRVVTIVPPQLREAHVAGFTRHLTTGVAHVIGVELTLPVLRADGSQLPCRFLIDRETTEDGRAVYIAWMDPVD